MEAWDLSEDEMSKDHARFLIGGKVEVANERVFRFGSLPFFFFFFFFLFFSFSFLS